MKAFASRGHRCDEREDSCPSEDAPEAQSMDSSETGPFGSLWALAHPDLIRTVIRALVRDDND